MDILIIFFIMLFLLKIDIKRKNDYLSLEYTKYLKGILALVVVFCHIQYGRTTIPMLKVFNYVGDLAVSCFFFFSGYGLISQYLKNSEGYLKTFFRKRIVKILFTYMIFICIYLIYYFINGTFKNFDDIITFTKNGSLIVSHSWYIIDIIILYVTFYIVAKIFKENYKFIIIGMYGFVTFLTFIMIYFGMSEFWYVSIFSLCFGMSYKIIQEKIDNKNIKKYYIIAIVIFIIFEILQFIISKMYDSILITVIVAIIKNVACISFTFLIISVGKYIQFKNSIFKFLGEVSLELYLIHGLFEKVFSNISFTNNNNFIYGLSVLVCSIVSAYLIHKFILIFKRSREKLKHKLKE